MNLDIRRLLITFTATIAVSYLLPSAGVLGLNTTLSLSSMNAVVAEQANKLNTLNTLMSGSVADPNATCPNCAPNISEISFMQCSSKNSYLQDDIAAAMQLRSEVWKEVFSPNPKIESLIKPLCIRTGMEERFGENSSTFRECSLAMTQNQPKNKRLVRPCIDDSYFKLVTNSFNLVSACMKDGFSDSGSIEDQKNDARAVFSLINVESGFHVNAISNSGAGGIGQLTQDSIEYINKNSFHNIQDGLQKSTTAVCRSLGQDILSEPMIPNPQKSCDRVAIHKGNPLKNMVYTYANLNISRTQIRDDLFGTDKYSKKFDLREKDQSELLRTLAVWSHNTGIAGIMTPVRAMLNIEYNKKRVTNISEFLTKLRVYIKKFQASANASTARRAETSSYYPKILETLQNIEKNIEGGSCIK